MAYRFSVGCCCRKKTDVCVPDCSLIADRIVLATEELLIDEAISTSRHCSGEDFWHGFYAESYYVYPLTNETVSVSGTDRARSVANSKIYQVSYYDASRKISRTSSLSDSYALEYFSSLLNSSNASQSAVESYFVTDSFDHRVHYRTSVQEPAWVQILAVPYDYATYPFRFTYDGTEAGYAAASRQSFRPLHPAYHTVADCGLAALTVSADYTNDAEAWAQYHTGTDQVYVISGENLDSWILSLADGSHHYGAEKFYVVRLGCCQNAWGYTTNGPSLIFPTATVEVIEFRFNRDKPIFSAMAPENVYTVNREYEETYNGLPGRSGLNKWIYGNPGGIPTSWKWTPLETPGEFHGRYFPLVYGVSHRKPTTTGAINGAIPLGRYSYTPPSSTSADFPRAENQTYADVFLAELTLEKKVYDWNEDDWRFFGNANTYSYGATFVTSLASLAPLSQPKAWCAWWRKGTSRVYGTKSNTPAGIISGGHVWAYTTNNYLSSIETNGSVRVAESGGASGIATAAAAPSGNWSLVSKDGASYYGIDASDYSQYGKINHFSSIMQIPMVNFARWVPEITDAIIDQVCPSGSYAVTNAVTNQEGKKFYVFPYVWCGMIFSLL